ncbi:copper amine oxidase N-terminal domain-containing protein [Paenibacillus sp. KQZ6P-2]|uniref:Copper amine oxidase N-terminal domain-containing protein n=1 Tax=Paenibacillus mangrovi TaxID=2931978 RepID=A0A9X1WMV8_9BACL|nr:copper amine oxidase N-terminal domain-containing protein [Paenibacillus mangrovi]MCJ8011814.1 copper amine oxidase N-terminal domain-containing protein [Paenibacillus mangrovi]
MKRISILLMALLICAAAMPVITTAAALPIRIVVNGDPVKLPDAQPFTDANNRLQVPIRFVSEALGAKVGWNNKARAATVAIGKNEITLTAGKKIYILNGKSMQMDTEVLLLHDRTFVPIRFVSEALGATVNWDGKVNTVYIDTSKIGQTPADTGTVDYYGFVLDPHPSSKLIVNKGSYGTLGKDYALISMRIVFNTKDASYEEQCADAESILQQKVDQDTVTAVMSYVKTKTTAEPELAHKEFAGTDYVIAVGSQQLNDISITVYKK